MENLDIKQFRTNILEEIEIRQNQSDTLKAIQDSLINGLKEQSQVQIFEFKQFDEEWIVGLESFFPSLEKITRDIRSTLRYEEEILPVEKTRRTNPQSIRHLLRNSRYIKEIKDDGTIIPEKVLNALSEIDYGMYENRFIMTLIDRLYTFLAERINVIKDNVDGRRKTEYKFSNNFSIDNKNFDLKITALAVEDLEIEDLDVHNHRVYHRLKGAFKNINSLYNSEFMKIMKRYKKVQAPILKTQIILKNPDFRQAYLLWLYLDRLHELEYTLRKEIKDKKIDKQYQNEIDQSIYLMLLTLFDNTNFGNNVAKNEKLSVKQIKPKLNVSSYDGNLSLEDIPIFDIEPSIASQFYLDQMKQVFKNQHREIARETKEPVLSLKKVLLEQYKIADQIYNYYFEADQDDDVFGQLLKESNPVKKYNEAYDKYIITRIARDVKEKMFDDSLDLEVKWINIVEELKDDALEYVTGQITEDHNNIISEDEKNFEKKLDQFEMQAKEKFETNVKKRNEQLEKRINKIREDYEERLKKFKAAEKTRIANAKKAIREKHNNAKKQINKSFSDESKAITKELANKTSIVKEEEIQNFNFNKNKVKKETNDELNNLKNKN